MPFPLTIAAVASTGDVPLLTLAVVAVAVGALHYTGGARARRLPVPAVIPAALAEAASAAAVAAAVAPVTKVGPLLGDGQLPGRQELLGTTGRHLGTARVEQKVETL